MANITQSSKFLSDVKSPSEFQTYLCGVGTSLTTEVYEQTDLINLFDIKDRKIKSVFLNGGIKTRRLNLPEKINNQLKEGETQADLLNKHLNVARYIGRQAIDKCLEDVGAKRGDISYLCCVTTTGFKTPGLSAYLIKDMGLNDHCGRLDVVGMGCNAGLNALNAVASWSQSNPGKLAILACIEVCSALYINEHTIEVAVVNSLFGDGAAAIAVLSTPLSISGSPKIRKFSSLIVTSAIEAMRIDWNDQHGRFSFVLEQDVPYVVGANAERACSQLLNSEDIKRSQIDHWIIHSGGKKVIDALKVNLGLSSYDVRHTLSVLRDFGNLSSGSFLFSYDRLVREQPVAPGSLGIMMTMGPGSTIETSLIEW